jgi:hypothetical protein
MSDHPTAGMNDLMRTTRGAAASRQVSARRRRRRAARLPGPGRTFGVLDARGGGASGRRPVERYRVGASRPSSRCDDATDSAWSTAMLAGETSGVFDADQSQVCEVCEVDLERAADPVRRLEAAVAALRERDTDELSEAELSDELAVVDRVRRRLEARSTRLAGALAKRRTRRTMDAERAAGRTADPSRASKRAKRQLRNELSERFDWTPADAKRAVELGEALGSQTSQETRDAFDAGELSARHAKLLADTLRWFEDPDERAEVEALLREAARREHPVAFGRTCRQLLAERDHAAAMTAERRRHARRGMSVWQTEDGMVGFRGQLAGLDGELLQTGLHAFRRPDGHGEHRTAEQASADAFVAMIRAALDAGKAPTTRSVRPHVTVRLDWETILARAGVTHTRWSGPLPFGEILRLLADCGVSRLLTDARGVPLEAGAEVRTVPAGTSRAVASRDLTCIADGCDVPAEWCQMMHLDTPYRLGGRLTPATAAPGCSHHHYLFDHKGWVVSWVDDDTRPVLHHPERPPRAQQTPPPARDGTGPTRGPSGRSATPGPTRDGTGRSRGPSGRSATPGSTRDVPGTSATPGPPRDATCTTSGDAGGRHAQQPEGRPRQPASPDRTRAPRPGVRDDGPCAEQPGFAFPAGDQVEQGPRQPP